MATLLRSRPLPPGTDIRRRLLLRQPLPEPVPKPVPAAVPRAPPPEARPTWQPPRPTGQAASPRAVPWVGHKDLTYSGNRIMDVRDIVAYPDTPDTMATVDGSPISALRFVDSNGDPVAMGVEGLPGPPGPAGAPGAPGPPGATSPPSGAAGGDLSGSYPNPLLKPGTAGQIMTTVGTAAAWAAPPSSAPSGAAGGDLSGSYPNPLVKPSVTNGQVLTTVAGVSAWATPAAPPPSTFVGTTAPASPVDGQLWYYSDASAGGGALYLRYNDGIGASQWVPASPAATPGSLIQTVYVETGAAATGTTIIPFDDTIPQISEGTEFITCSITPRSATSKLIIEVVVFMANSAATQNMTAALFQDATANALAAGYFTQPNASYSSPVSFRHAMTSGTTSATTFRIRAGGSAVGTTTFNGNGGTRYFGGVMASSIVIQEVA